jgi:hypothetical protein
MVGKGTLKAGRSRRALLSAAIATLFVAVTLAGSPRTAVTTARPAALATHVSGVRGHQAVVHVLVFASDEDDEDHAHDPGLGGTGTAGVAIGVFVVLVIGIILSNVRRKK